VRDDPERGIFRVHRAALGSAALPQLEGERVFDHCWQGRARGWLLL